jgi:oligopeptide transport system ATP-binding protein
MLLQVNHLKTPTLYSRSGPVKAVDDIFLLCDVPVSALDVSIQAQIINLRMALQEKFGLTYGLSVMKCISQCLVIPLYRRYCHVRTRFSILARARHVAASRRVA